MNTANSTTKKSLFSNKWIKTTFAIFLSLYLIIWAISSPVSKYFIEPILLEQGLSLSNASNISYNPFLSQLTVSDLTLYKKQHSEQETVLSIKKLTVRLTLYRLLFDKIVVSKFELTDAFLKIEKTANQLIIAGIDINKESTETSQSKDPIVESPPFAYQLILPELAINQVSIDINNNDIPHQIQIKTLLISQLSANQDAQKALLSLQSSIDNTNVELNANANFEQGLGEINSQLSITNYPLNKLQPYVEQLSDLKGSLSFTSKQQVSISPVQFKLHVNQAKISNENLVVGYQQQLFNLANVDSTFNDLTLAFSEGEITALSGTSQLVLNKAEVHLEQPNQKLAYFEQLALKDISFHFNDEPQVKVANFVIEDIYASKNNDTELPPLVTLKQFTVSDIFITEKQLSIDKIILNSLQSDVIINKEKVLANLVTVPVSQAQKNINVKEEKVSKVTRETEEQTTPKKSDFIVSLNEFSLINNNQISLLDNSIEPIKKHLLFIDTLSLGALSNTADKREKQTPLAFKGRSDKYAHFDFTGFTKPFAQQPTHHLQGFLKELSLPPMSRYIKQAIGIELKSGQLNTDVNVTLTGEQLVGNVVILLRSLETAIADSNEAGALIDQGALPFNMALGMLKDSSGDVELDVPLSGSTSDPSFGLSSIVTLITQKAIWMATKDYLMTTFVPYANIVSAAMSVGEFALKLRFEDLIYQKKQIEPNEEQQAYLNAFIALMQDKEKTRVNICAISTPADINLIAGSKITDKNHINQLKEMGEKREEAFKDYIIKHGKIASSRLLLCAPKIDSSKEAKPRITLSV